MTRLVRLLGLLLIAIGCQKTQSTPCREPGSAPADAKAPGTAAPIAKRKPEPLPEFGEAPLQVVNQIGHTNTIRQLVHTPDGNKVLSSSADGTVRVWHAPTGALILTFNQHPDPATALTVTPDGKQALSGSTKGQVLVWDIATGKVVRELDCGDWVGSIAVSPDGRQVLTGCRGGITLWDLETGRSLRKHSTNGHPVDAVGFTKRGPLAVWDRKLTMYVYDLGRQQMAYTKTYPRRCDPARMLFSPDFSILVVGTWYDHAVRLYDAASGKLIRELEGQRYEIADATLSPDGKQLITCGRDQTIHAWDLGTGKRRYEFSLSPKVIKWSAVSYAPDGYTFIAANQRNENPARLRRFDAATGELLATFTGGQWIPQGVGISADGTRAAVGVRDDSLLVWDIERAEAERVLLPGKWDSGMTRLVMSRDGTRAAAAMGDWVYFWDLTTGKYERQPLGRAGSVEIRGAGQYENLITGFTIRSLDMSLDGRWVAASGHGGRVRVWDSATGAVVLSINEELGDLQMAWGYASLLTPDGKLLWGVSNLGPPKLALTDVGTKREIRTYPPDFGRPLAISPDGRLVAVRKNERVRIVELMSARLICELDSLYRQVVFDSTSRRLLGVRGDTTLSLFDAGTCKLERRLQAPTGKLTTVSVDGRAHRVITGDTNGSARIWDLRTGRSVSITASGEDWLIYTDDGYFDASRNGGRLVAFVQEGRAFRAEQVAALYNRPDVILERMGFGSQRTRSEYQALFRNRVHRLNLTGTVGALSQAPTVHIVDLETRGRRGRIVFEARATDSELSRADVLVNEVPVTSTAGLPARGREQRFEVEVELLPGTNRVEVTATDRAGLPSLRAFRTVEVKEPAAAKPRLYYLGFGVSRYARQDYNLAYPHKDALDLALVFQAMQGKFSEVRVATFLNEYATRENLQGAKRLLSDARPEDVLVVFVAGHGLHTDDYYFLTHETDLKHLAETAVPFSSIEDLVADVAPRNKLLLVDTCHSGDLQEDELPAAAELPRAGGARPRVARALILDRERAGLAASGAVLADGERFIHRRLLIRHGASVLVSSRGSELSYEMPELKNGVFTKAILRALTTREGDANGDGQLSLDELRRSVSGRVAQMTNAHQHPIMRQENRSSPIAFPIVEHARPVLTRPENVGAGFAAPVGYAPFKARALRLEPEPVSASPTLPPCPSPVSPGARGCGCHLRGASAGHTAAGLWFAGLLLAALRVRRRRRTPRGLLVLACVGCSTAPPTSATHPVTSATPRAGSSTQAAAESPPLECPTGMVPLPGGTFPMGSNEGTKHEAPVHTVTLTPYCLARTEVTAGEYELCVEAGACPDPGPERVDNVRGGLCWRPRDRDAKLPRDCVTVEQALAYCTWKQQRLPTEAEWEFAARGGMAGSRYPTGNEPPDATTACLARKDNPCVPRSFPPEVFGLYDLAGNVMEWVADSYAPYPSEPQTNPLVLTGGDYAVARGGSHRHRSGTQSRATRREITPRDAWPSVGFRCAWSP